MRLSLARIAPAACLLLVTALPAGAATITGDFLFTENRGPNPFLSSGSGWTFLLGATTVSPAGPSTTVTATHVPLGSGPDFIFSFLPSGVSPNQYGVVVPYAGQTGQWDLTAVDGGTTTRRTHTLDDPRQLPLISGLTATGPWLTPHLTWDAVDPHLFPSLCSQPNTGGIYPDCVVGNDFYTYQVEVRRRSGDPANPAPVIFASAPMLTLIPGTFDPAPTEFDIPLGVLAPNEQYLLGIRLLDNELEAILAPFPNPQFFSPLENRSAAYLVHATIPAPPTALLLGLGALGAAVGSRRIGMIRRKSIKVVKPVLVFAVFLLGIFRSTELAYAEPILLNAYNNVLNQHHRCWCDGTLDEYAAMPQIDASLLTDHDTATGVTLSSDLSSSAFNDPSAFYGTPAFVYRFQLGTPDPSSPSLKFAWTGSPSTTDSQLFFLDLSVYTTAMQFSAEFNGDIKVATFETDLVTGATQVLSPGGSFVVDPSGQVSYAFVFDFQTLDSALFATGEVWLAARTRNEPSTPMDVFNSEVSLAWTNEPTPTRVPEPSSLILLVLGLIGVAFFRFSSRPWTCNRIERNPGFVRLTGLRRIQEALHFLNVYQGRFR